MNKIPTLFSAVTLLCSSICIAQNQSFVIIKGSIVDASTGKGIPYASVGLIKSSINTVSNEQGGFVFKIPENHKKDSIYVSHVAYQPYTFIDNKFDTGLVLIRLKEKINKLNDVVIKTINPLELIKKAIAQIPVNYPSTPYILHGFYRTTGTKEKRIIDLSEAVFDIYGDSYTAKDKKLKLIRSRLDMDLTAFNGNDGLSFGAKPESMFEDDIVGDVAHSDLLSKDGLKDHQFTFVGMVDYNGRDAYEIRFDQKDDVKKSLNKGKLIIDAENLAFLEFDIEKSPKGLKYWQFGFMQRLALNLAKISAEHISAKGVITYSKYGDKYYVNRVYGIHLLHLAGSRKQFEINPLYIKYNFLITGIDTTNLEVWKKEEILANKKLIEHMAPDNTDSTDQFWGNYNLIQAEFNVDSAAKVIRAQNETLNFKRVLDDKLFKMKKDKALRIDSILSFYHNKNLFNGTALVSYDGKVIYEKAFGQADKEKNIPNTPQTQFRIGSTSKQFTAMLVMQLVNENKLSVEDSVGKFIPDYRNGRVTVQQLLTHQSGIPNYTDLYFDKIVLKKYSVDEIVRKFCSDSLEFEPGTKFKYSNSGFVVLADIIEKITGKSYAVELSERIFTPLGMQHSYFGPVLHNATMAIGYINDEKESAYPIENEAGAGGIVSTAEDLLLWHNALSAGTILPKEKVEEMLKPRVQWDEYDASYGYGWMIDRLQFNASKKHTIQYHPGTEFGFFDMLVRQPDKNIFIILLNNKSDFPRFDMTDLILNELN